MDIDYEPSPIKLGLAGQSGTGKTATANALAPQAAVGFGLSDDDSGRVIVWDHLAFALPLKRIVTARQTIEGDGAVDRILYEIHDTLVDAFVNPLYGAPPYDDLVQLVYQIAEHPCPAEGKARALLQFAGTLCREHNEMVWVNWVDKKVNEGWIRFMQEREKMFDEQDDDINTDVIPTYGVVISDCRLKNEMEYINKDSNGILIRLRAKPETIVERQRRRDGFEMETEHKSHETESHLDDIPDSYFDAIIDTDDIPLKEQVNRVKEIVTDLTGAKA